ncbi:NmrA family NAD(P)-binding protein [Chitinophaga jiangningensis]|nr:NmrA family NAD(P)-binding protein [Chitinophaga jiangningensis]
MPATILRPPGFMENVLLPTSGIAGGKLYDPTPAHLKVPYIATWDIGTFAVKAFEDPAAFIGKTLDLAGDQLTASEIAAKIGNKLQKSITHVQVPITVLTEQSPLLGELFSHLNAQGYPQVDIAALKTIHPGLLSFSEWLETTQVIPV